MSELLCVDLNGSRDGRGRVPRSKIRGELLDDKQETALARASQAVRGTRFRERGNGVLLELEVGEDGAPAHTTCSLAFRKPKRVVRRAAIGKPVLPVLRLIDYGPRKRSANVSGTADGDRRRPLTSTDRDALKRAIADTFILRVDTGARGAAIPMRGDDFKRVLGVGECGRLSDAHVNAYCELVNKRNARYFWMVCGQRSKPRGTPAADDSQALLQGGRQRMFIFSSFLYTKLVAPHYEYGEVKRWTQKSDAALHRFNGNGSQ